MFKRILAAHDGSSPSVSALRHAADLACCSDAELHLIGIVHTSGARSFAEATANDLWGMEKDHVQQAINVVSIDFGKQGLDVVMEIRLGDPAREIIDYAGNIKADLVVIGNTEKGIFARWLEGSTGVELLNHLPCNLLITTKDA